MKVHCYLVVNSDYGVRVTKQKPNVVKNNEVAIKVALNIPDLLFVQPMFSATIEIPEDAAMPSTIPVEVQMDAMEAIQRATGMKVELQVSAPSPSRTYIPAGERCEVDGCLNDATTIESGEWLCHEHRTDSGRGA